MAESVFDYETKTFLSLLAIALIGVAIVISQQPIASNAVFTSQLFKKAPTDTFIIKDIDIGEFIGRDTPSLTKNELKSLADGSVVTNEGRTNYSQYLFLQKTSGDGFDGGKIMFGRDSGHKTGHYVFFEKNYPLFEYAIIFSRGLSSRVENNRLVDLENKYLNIMGKSFVIVQTFVDVQQKVVKLRLMGRDGIIDFEDRNYGDSAYTSGAMINNKQVDAGVKIAAFYSNNRFIISEIRYSPFATTRGAGDVYVAERQGLRGRLKDGQAMLVPSLEIIYGGISGGSAVQRVGGGEFVIFQPKGTSQYDLSFVNDLGISYDIPLVNSDSNFKYGSRTKNLVFYEGDNNADFNIVRGDYFVVNNKVDIHGVTNVVEYNGINYDDGTIYFYDIGSRDKKAVPFEKSTGLGYLNVFGNTYLFYVSSASDHKIVVDQNADGVIDGGEAKVVLRGGGRLDLGSANVPGGSSASLTLTTPKRLFAEPTSDEVVSFNIVKSGSTLNINVPNQDTVTMYHQNNYLDKGMTRFGVYFLRDSRDKTASQLIIEYPRAAVFTVSSAAQGKGAVAVTLEREKYLRKQE